MESDRETDFTNGYVCSSRRRFAFCALSFLLLLAANASFAETSLNVGIIPGYPGSTVPVPVNLTKATNVTAAQFDVTFNTNKVASGAVLLGASFSNHVVKSREIAPGVRRVLVYSLKNSSVTFTNGGELAKVPFTVSPQEHVGSGPITPTGALLAKPDATGLAPLSLQAGTIFIQTVHLNDDGSAQFFLPSEVDRSYVIQATTNFMNWFNISTNTATGNYLDLIDMDAHNYRFRFYRWLQEP
jgi:hypothetical protein